MASDESQPRAVEKLQDALDRLENKTKQNEVRTCHINPANGVPVPQAESAKYLGLHLDSKLNWKHHVKKQTKLIKVKVRVMNWLIGYKLQLNLYSKRYIYQTIVRPIFSYIDHSSGLCLKTNRQIIQERQNNFQGMITNVTYNFES